MRESTLDEDEGGRLEPSGASPRDGEQAGAPSTTRGSILSWVRRRPPLNIAAAFIVLAAIYWSLVASDRYISEAHIVIDRTDYNASQSLDLGSLITGGSSRDQSDMLLLRDHLRSFDMLEKLQGKLDLRQHYSDKSSDILSRMWSPAVPQELFLRYYLRRTSIEMDDAAGVLRIRAEAFEPAVAQAIARALLSEGERFMNEMGHRLAREQVAFLERQVAESGQRSVAARKALLDFQNKTGLIAPQAQAENLVAIAGRIEGQLAELKARRSAMIGYLSPTAPDVAQLDLQIGALERQLVAEQRRLATPKGGSLNRSVEEYQRLELEASFAQDVYRTSLVGLEKGRVDAARTLKKISVLQSPNLPEYPLRPERIYNLIVFAVAALAVAGILQLLVAVVRDHRD